MTRVAVLGTGSMGRIHAEALATIPEVQVVAVIGRTHETAASIAAPLGAQAYGDLSTMLAQNQVDVVDCCLPTPLHRAAVERIAAHGCHVICEKPMALSVADGAAMIAACNAAGVHLLMAMVLRFVSGYNILVEAMRVGRIGTPVTATLLRQGFYPTGRDAWFRDDAQSGGVLLDLLIHDFDWVLWQFGPAERVYAKLVQRAGESPFAQGMVTIRHRSGVLSLVTGTWGHPGPFTSAIEIAGSAGLLSGGTEEAQPLRLLTPPAASDTAGVPLPDLSAEENPYRIQLAHFMDVVAGRAVALVTPTEALTALKLALAARQSAETGQPVAIAEEVGA